MPTPRPRAKDVFLDAVEVADPAARAAFVDTACAGDAELRRRVEALLAAHERPESLLDRAAVAVVGGGTLPHPPAGGPVEGPGTRVGPYLLLEPLGEGGMGSVFLAEQGEPVRRRVALKVIKPGMDTAQVVTRFEAEKQALALMDHPNIARVLDAGATPAGRPYFVMERVDGVPITHYCDEHRLTPRRRLELFIPVCQAVQHAHQKGIIHRDIKPSNVLVTEVDGEPVPKVIDFGIAKAVDPGLTGQVTVTQAGTLVGTPEYMSPEQAGAGPDVDTRTDVYGLGVLLYELLTGTTPIDRASLTRASLDEVLRRVREEEPPRPSTRLSGTGDRLPSVAAVRATEPARLAKLVRGDLDWVVMKALEKDRARRYETANGLARDLQRYLDGDPVEAGPPSRAYRLEKFARKHRAALATAAAFCLVMAGAAVVSSREAWKALRAESDAIRQRDRARKAVDTMYTEVAEQWLARQPRMRPLQRRFLEEALSFYEEFAREPAASPEDRHRMAIALRRVAAIRVTLGQHGPAAESYGRAIHVLDRLAAERPDVAEHRWEMASALWERARFRKIDGGTADSADDCRRALTLLGPLVSRFPERVAYRNRQAACLNLLGNIHLARGQWIEGERVYDQARPLLEVTAADPDVRTEARRVLRSVLRNLGTVYAQTDRLPEAVEAVRRAVEISEGLLAADPDSFDLRHIHGSDLEALGEKLQDAGRWDEAEPSLRRAREIQERLVVDDWERGEHREDLALTLIHLAEVSVHAGQPDDAARDLRRSITLLEELLRATPALIDRQYFAAKALKDLAVLERDRGRTDDARAHLAAARAHIQAGLEHNPQYPQLRRLAAEVESLHW